MPARRIAMTLCVMSLLPFAGCSVAGPSKNTVLTFSGTLEVGLDAVHEFTVRKNGEFDARVSALAPTSDIFVGLAVGQFSGSTCAIFQSTRFARVGQPTLGGGITSGKYCVIIFDVGTLAQASTYTIQVSHP